MKNYIKPEIEITSLNNSNVIMVSGINTTKFTAASEAEKTYTEIEF